MQTRMNVKLFKTFQTLLMPFLDLTLGDNRCSKIHNYCKSEFFANANNQENGVEAMHSFSVASHMSEISDLLKS